MPRKKKPAPAKKPPSEPSLRRLPKSIEEVFQPYFPGGLSRRDEANAIVAYAFRNGPLEDLHAGKFSEILSDSGYSRLTDAEMKTLMLDACRKMEELLRLKDSNLDEYHLFIAQYAWGYCRRWER